MAQSVDEAKQRAKTGKTGILRDLYCVLCFNVGFAKHFGTRGYGAIAFCL